MIDTKPNKTESLVQERHTTHGNWMDQAATAQVLKNVIRTAAAKASQNKGGFAQLTPQQLEALDMTCAKISRIIWGNANEPDHWDDIGGYANLGKNSGNLAIERASTETISK